MASLREKLLAKVKAADAAYFVRPYLAETYSAAVDGKVNDAAALKGDDLLLLNGRLKAHDCDIAASGPSEVGVNSQGDVIYAHIAASDVGKLDTGSIDALISSAAKAFGKTDCDLPTWQYAWDLVLENPEEIVRDFTAAGRTGIEGEVEEPTVVRGSAKDVYIAPGAQIQAMTVIDASEGPIYIDEEAVVHPFTRIEGPCYIGKKSLLLGTKCREGNSIGPVCRLGGEIEGAIIHGHSNKYHDGFLGHAYVGEWVNLGALTSNSDLKNDYSNVSVVLDGLSSVDTGSLKVGSLIGDHSKTSIGTVLNTGAYVGPMTILVAAGPLIPKFVPAFTAYLWGRLTEKFTRERLYGTAAKAMGRRKKQWTDADVRLWDHIWEMTAPRREAAMERQRKKGS
jgi:UDP-N-acetylglucosamine diphosphorylase/glucosamine-1-phosphate N-acetyltransferase